MYDKGLDPTTAEFTSYINGSSDWANIGRPLDRGNPHGQKATNNSDLESGNLEESKADYSRFAETTTGSKNKGSGYSI